jgi:hypothetical protein
MRDERLGTTRNALAVLATALAGAIVACSGSTVSIHTQRDEDDAGPDAIAEAGRSRDATGLPDSAEAGPKWESDPCPEKLAVNCSTSCGGPFECDKVRCQELPSHNTPTYYLYDEREFPVTIRTPERPPQDSECGAICGPAAPRFAIGLAVDGVVFWHYRVRVAAPWRIVQAERPKSYCPKEGGIDYGSCRAVHKENTLTLIVTDDPDAPARNIVIEKIAPDGGCP